MSPPRRRKKDGFLKEFPYRKQDTQEKQEMQLDEILVKMEDSMNYEDFQIGLQNAPKGGVSPKYTTEGVVSPKKGATRKNNKLPPKE